MLVLTFQVAGMAYAVAAARVVEVVPRVELRPIPHAPAHMVGLLRYRGWAVPVADLGLLMGSGPCRDRLDTRIILVKVDAAEGQGSSHVGLIAERVEGVQRVDPADRAIETLDLPDAPFLGEAYQLEEGLFQMIDPARIAMNLAYDGRAVAP